MSKVNVKREKQNDAGGSNNKKDAGIEIAVEDFDADLYEHRFGDGSKVHSRAKAVGHDSVNIGSPRRMLNKRMTMGIMRNRTNDHISLEAHLP